ncbi:putative WD40 repeat protein [Trypanosoma conorhini]|uniref:Putative WD40 repeat protein n=1 Tax=Trypanosoma conorhini TaxID=83891 RepID=A0A3R7LJB1_9TRYP|nr:putative WD40 repeat protein [Trypanosoma conorhini]RNF15602.1 putative WD40 repeat protein [Trypanosoma conorhini]
MRQWAYADLDSTPSGRPSGKRRTRASGTMSLQELSANTLQLIVRSPGDEDAPPVRLSRHIPQREGMDMAVSAYNLTSASSTTTTLTMPPVTTAAGGVGVGGGSGGLPLPHSAVASHSSLHSESFVSDDSSYVMSIYNEVLAEQLSEENTQRHRKIGGEVLRFDSTDAIRSRGPPLSLASIGGAVARGCVSSRGETVGRAGTRHSGKGGIHALAMSPFTSSPAGNTLVKRLKPGKPLPQRVLFTNPERVLDAPNFPLHATQLLHWGSNNKLVIGLRNSLYGWDSATAQASLVVQLQDSMHIRAVHWLHKCACIALALDGGVTAIYDCRNEEFLRTVRVRLPSKEEFTYLAVNGPLLSIGTSTSCGGIYVFDLRAKHALTTVYEGHTSGITALHYCTEEPFYLASGSADGSVRVWDARRNSSPRYAFDHVHSGPVNSILWNPDKRSKMYTGGQDGMLCYVDTHAPLTNVPPILRGDEEGPTTGSHFVTRGINTLHPVSGIVSPPGANELATSHNGKGHIQVRQANNFHLVGTLNSPNCEAGILCPTLAPDMERICAAQGETLKFWRVFAPNVPQHRAKSATPPPVSQLEKELR